MAKKNEATKPKRHCMIVHAHYPLGEPRVEREAQALIRAGYEVDVLCLRKEGELPSEVIEAINIYRLPVKRDKGRGLAAQMGEYLAFFMLVFLRLFVLYPRRKYRTVQVHNLPDFLVFSAVLPKLAGARIILDLHDLMPEFFAGTYSRPMDSLPLRILKIHERISCWFADHVITVTGPWRNTLIQRGVPARKVSVVMNVADSRIFSGDSPRPIRNGNGRFRLIYHGNIAQRYGIDILLRAVAQVREIIPQIHLTVHGRGDYHPEVVRLAEELCLNGHLTLSTNLLPMTDLPAFIGQADLGVVPYRRDIFTDGILPTKLMEYTAVHVPAIVARTPVIESYFDENMVQYFPAEDVKALADAIVHLYNDRERLAQLASESDRFNQMYAWKNVAERYVALVNQLAE